MKKLEEVMRAEEEHFRRVREELGAAFDLAQRVEDVYELFKKLIGAARLHDKPEVHLALRFLLGCQYELAMAVLHITRRHFLESYQSARRAIEHCGSAARVIEDPTLVGVWERAGEVRPGERSEEYGKYRNEFRVKRLFPKEKPLRAQLGLQYDAYSKMSHPSAVAFKEQFQITVKPSGGWSMRCNFFRVRPDRPEEPLMRFLGYLSDHCLILRVFAEALPEAVARDPVKWEQGLGTVDALIQAQWIPLQRWLVERYGPDYLFN